MTGRYFRLTRAFAAVSMLAVVAGTASAATDAAPTTATTTADIAEPASIASLVDEVNIPYEKFTLDNGLTVVVHEDRKAPLVAMSVWYDVGSKHEPAGKTGFAHLFEHLMFNGSENAPGDFFEPLQQVGATDFNGTTNADRTNYFQTVPTGALQRGLMLESDRMGYLLGAVTQEKLDNQRGVVQNEKRRGDNQPFGLLRYEVVENIFPKGHPYHHSTIGSMADLDAASLDDVKDWFRANYGPNNAVLVLAGDIDAATARPMVEKWFGAIERGPGVVDPAVTVPVLEAVKEKVINDQVSTTRIYRMWPIPGEVSDENIPIQMGASVLGGLSSSRLDNSMVRNDPVAVSVAAWTWTNEEAGVLVVQADVKDGVDPAEVAAKLDAQIADFIATGPTADELSRATTSQLSSLIGGWESVGGFGGKAVVLAQGELYFGNPGNYKDQIEQAAALTPDQVSSVVRKWMSRPHFSLIVEPGDRTEGGENRGGAVSGSEDGLMAAPLDRYCEAVSCAAAAVAAAAAAAEADRSQLPAVGELQGLDFPNIERARLANGMEIYFARRTAVPKVSVRMQFDAGYAADPRDALGTQSLMLALMDEGTTSLDSAALAEAQERLGASINGFADADATSFQLSALSANLTPSLNLLADFVRNPAFDVSELERVRAQQLNRITSELKSPDSIAGRALSPILYGADHPYGMPPSGTGEKAVVQSLGRDELVAFHATWLRPDNAKVFVVGDTTLEEVTADLNRTFGNWQAPATPVPTKNFDADIPAPSPRVVLIDRPNSPQSVITAGRVLNLKGGDDLVVLRAANEVYGGSFLSRINMNLRETKGWSYGVRSRVSGDNDRIAFTISAPVQADRTADSVLELRRELTDFVGTNGVSAAELERMINNNVRALPGQFETSNDVLGGIVNIVNYGRPDDYYETIADRYRTMTAEEIKTSATSELLDSELVFVIVGDADVVRPQLDALGLAVEERSADN